MLNLYWEVFVIIKTINFSYPRKIVIDNINNLIFNSKLKDIRLNRNNKIIGYTIGIIFFSQQLAYANPAVEKSTNIINFLNNYGPPLILTAGDLLKLGISRRIHMKKLQIPHN